MAKLQLPQSNLESIKQDYQDKHASSGGAVLVCRKYDRQVKDKNGQHVFDKNGNPVNYKAWHEAKKTTATEYAYVRNSFQFSEKWKNDCYCTLNSFPTGCTRSADNVAYLTGFYLDFDHVVIHSLAKKQQAPPKLAEEVLGYAGAIAGTLEAYFSGDFGMPVISFTGGGYGFYFKISPIEATTENRALYMDVWKKLYLRFSALFDDILDVFENDHSVIDVARVIRITGTYNSKTGTYSCYIGRYGNESTNEVYEYSLAELTDLYHLDEVLLNPLQEKEKKEKEKKEDEVSLSPLQKRKERERGEEKKGKVSLSPLQKEKKEKKKEEKSNPDYTKRENVAYPTKWYQGYAPARQLGRYLDLAVRSLRYLDGQGALQRNNALFLVACLATEIEYAKYGYYIFDNKSFDAQRTIVNYVMDLNGGLTVPLEAEELTTLLNSALANKYHFRKLVTIQKFLGLTDEDFSRLGWMDNRQKEEAKHQRNNALTDLDKEIIKLYLSGLSDAKIANALNIPKLQSIRVRKRLGVMDRNVKFDDIDFDGRKRHLRHNNANEELIEIEPFFQDTPWYTPRSKSIYARNFRLGIVEVKNAVQERGKIAVEDCSGSVELAMRLRMLQAQVAQMSQEEKQKIIAGFDETRKQYSVDFWEEIG